MKKVVSEEVPARKKKTTGPDSERLKARVDLCLRTCAKLNRVLEVLNNVVRKLRLVVCLLSVVPQLTN